MFWAHLVIHISKIWNIRKNALNILFVYATKDSEKKNVFKHYMYCTCVHLLYGYRVALL